MSETDRDGAAIEWLLASTEPAVRYLARRDLLGEESAADRDAILHGARIRALLAGQQRDGSFGEHPYQKWRGAHWRLVSLVEHAIPPGEPRAVAAAETVLTWLTGRGRLDRLAPPVAGLPRRHASIEGNALAVCARLGLAADPRVASLAAALVTWQWPDGGWNCDPSPAAHRSSFHESLGSMWGLHEYAAATGDKAAATAVARAGELFLEHRLFKSLQTGEPIRRDFAEPHYPPYWHYDVLQALLVLGRAGLAGDPRTADAVELLRSRQRPDGRWRPARRWRTPPGSGRPAAEVLDWGRGADEMTSLNALRALRAAQTSSA